MKELPNKENLSEEYYPLFDEIKEKAALKSLAHSEGGKLLIKSSLESIASIITRLTAYKTLSDRDLISSCAQLETALSLYRALTQAESNEKELVKILEEALV